MADQLDPSQSSVKAWLNPRGSLALPTAVQNVAVAHEIEARDELTSVGLGICDHFVPSHFSISVVDGLLCEPTAMHITGLVHDTPARALLPADQLPGTSRSDHVVPFHDSANGVLGPSATI
jgi:hypothetical protein